MSSWADRRKFTYGGIVIIILIIGIAIPAWTIFYKAPTCFDGKKNGDEMDTDCGGSCTKLCPSAFLSPVEKWTRFEQTAPGVYNVAAYIVNPNPDVEAFGVPYRVQIYDNKGILVTEYKDTVILPPRRNTLAFRGGVNVGSRIPFKAVFEFTGIPDWHKQKDRISEIVVTNKSYTEEANSSALLITLKNKDVFPAGKMTVYAILYNKVGNAIGFSRTVIDGIVAGATANAPFTWPTNRNGEVISIEVLPVAQ